jgi:hypothetical protein
MKETDKAYIAGIIDGEGCIIINRTKTNKIDGYIKPYKYALHIKVRTCDNIITPNLKQKLKIGSLHICKAYKKNHRISYEWHTASNNALKVLIILLPYLKLKKKQAKIGIKYQKSKKHTTHSGKALSEESYKFQQKCYKQLKKLNKRGY